MSFLLTTILAMLNPHTTSNFLQAVSFDLIWMARDNKIHKDYSKPDPLTSPRLQDNFDTTIRTSHFPSVAIGKSSKRSIIFVIAILGFTCDPTVGEAFTALHEVKSAQALHCQHLFLEGDSSAIILSLQKPLLTANRRNAPIISNGLVSSAHLPVRVLSPRSIGVL